MHDAVVLIFADRLGHELARKGIARRHADLFALPQLDGVDADVLVSGGHGETFAQRLRSAVAEVAHYKRIVIIGRDCPMRSVDDVRGALDALRDSDMVLGPDGRGGCWLIGLRGEDVSVLDGVRWCCGHDFAQLAGRASRPVILAVKADIDGSADLPTPTPAPMPVPAVVVTQFVADRWQLPPPCAA